MTSLTPPPPRNDIGESPIGPRVQIKSDTKRWWWAAGLVGLTGVLAVVYGSEYERGRKP